LAAESKVGKRFRLHDLKRFSGELALRAGATPLELQQHMDHADIRTTLTHYCRPVTTALVCKFKYPMPGTKHQRTTPLFTEPELKSIIESGIIRRLVEAGVDAATIKFVLDDYGNVDFGDSLSNDGGVRPSVEFAIRRVCKLANDLPQSCRTLISLANFRKEIFLCPKRPAPYCYNTLRRRTCNRTMLL